MAQKELLLKSAIQAAKDAFDAAVAKLGVGAILDPANDDAAVSGKAVAEYTLVHGGIFDRGATLDGAEEWEKAIKSLKIKGADLTETYHISWIDRNYDRGDAYTDKRYIWQVRVEDSTGTEVLRWLEYSYSEPEGVDKIELPAANGSELEAIIWIDWGEITDGDRTLVNEAESKINPKACILDFDLFELNTQVYTNTKLPFHNDVEFVDPEIGQAIKNVVLYNADLSKQYRMMWIDRRYDNGTNLYNQVYIYDQDDNEFGSFSEANYSEPTGVDKVALSDGANIVGYVWIDWSEITDGQRFVGMDYSECGLHYSVYEEDNPEEDVSAEIYRAVHSTVNQFPGILDKLPNTKTKILERDTDLKFVMLGDSIFARGLTNTLLDEAPNLPPGCQTKAVAYQLYDSIVRNKPQNDRFDSAVHAFTESGTWTSEDELWESPSWSLEARREGSSLTRVSSSENASFSFSWDLDSYEKLSLIHRLSTRGVDTVTLAVDVGAGYVEVYDEDTEAWVEANAFTFTQWIDDTVATEGSGYSHHVANKDLQFRKASGATGSVTITASKGANTDELYYWGTQRWNRYTTQIFNVARGGRKTHVLQKNFLNDVVERSPDLVIFELPLLNDYKDFTASGYDGLLDRLQDFIWGDRAGAETQLSLKNQSNDWSDFEVLLILPHSRSAFWDGDQPVTWTNDGADDGVDTPYAAQQRIKNLIDSKGDVAFIDMNELFLREGKMRGWTHEETTTASSDGSTDSFTTDGTHINELGAYTYAKYIGPIFDVTS